ncbi:MAG: PrgI family protein [Patescibacteria group bacterium]
MPDQYKIPQNIDIEDKILGPFTLRQFLYMIGGGSLLYILFLSFGQSNFTLFVLIALPVALLVFALVFIRVNEQPFLGFLQSFIIYSLDPKIKIWKKSTHIKSIMAQSAQEATHGSRAIVRRSKKGALKSRLAQLTTIIDTQGYKTEAEDTDLGDRIVSPFDTETTPDQLTVDESNLDDVFGDLERSIDRIAPVKVEEERDVAQMIGSLLSKK